MRIKKIPSINLWWNKSHKSQLRFRGILLSRDEKIIYSDRRVT